MGIQNDGELFSEAELDALRTQNQELKNVLGEAYLDTKILKKS